MHIDLFFQAIASNPVWENHVTDFRRKISPSHLARSAHPRPRPDLEHEISSHDEAPPCRRCGPIDVGPGVRPGPSAPEKGSAPTRPAGESMRVFAFAAFAPPSAVVGLLLLRYVRSNSSVRLIVPFHRVQSIREMVTKKFEGHEELLTNMIKQRQGAVDDHLSGRKLLNDEVSQLCCISMGAHCPLLLLFIHGLHHFPSLQELARHQTHLKGLQRKLAAHKQKDPDVRVVFLRPTYSLFIVAHPTQPHAFRTNH